MSVTCGARSAAQRAAMAGLGLTLESRAAALFSLLARHVPSQPRPNAPSLVLGTLQPLVKTEPERACYRLIGGVLVQRTVKDVAPTLETNYAGIKEVLETLVKTYKSKEEEFGAFQREHKISVSRAGERALARGRAHSG